MLRSFRHAMRHGAAALLGGVLLLSLGACDMNPVTTPSASVSASASSVPTAAAPAGSAVPSPGLSNVHTDDGHAASAPISADGGMVSATSADGTSYTLTLPPGAVQETTQISLDPVTALAGLPAGSSISAGVQFGPDGLILDVPATLTVRLPAGKNATGLTAVSWRGDGIRPHLYPSGADGQVVTLKVMHFSGIGLDPAAIELSMSCADFDYQCVNDQLEQQLVVDEGHEDARDRFVVTLRVWYLDVIDPVLTNDLREFAAPARGQASRSDLEQTYAFYGAWRYAIYEAGVALHDQSFTIRDVGPSESQLVQTLRAFSALMNRQCAQSSGDSTLAVSWADLAIRLPSNFALGYSLNTRANQLDLETLLDESCVQVVIDPARDYSGVAPDDLGTVTVPTGFAIAGGPVRHDLPISVAFTVDGDSTPFATSAADAEGVATAPLAWPPGTDPLKIDVLARLARLDQGAVAGTDLARFDRITKHAEQLTFPFDTSLEGWRQGTAGPKGSANWGTVYHLPKAGGSVQLDGSGAPSRPNAWISKTFTLPTNAATLAWEVSAHNRLGADTHFRVRIVDATASATLEDVVLTHSGPDGMLSFAAQSVDISEWAGKVVTIFFEQNDNGINGQFPGGDEQVHLDNVRITQR